MANKSQIAGFALEQIAVVYGIEREVNDWSANQRHAIWQRHTKLLFDALHERMVLQRQKIYPTAQPQPRRWITACGAGLC